MKAVVTKPNLWNEIRRPQFWCVIASLTLFVLFVMPLVEYLFILSYRVAPSGAIAIVGLSASVLLLLLAIRCNVRAVKAARKGRREGKQPHVNWLHPLALVLAMYLLMSACIPIAVDQAAGSKMVSDEGLAALRRALLWFMP
jgi:hypothetical protein